MEDKIIDDLSAREYRRYARQLTLPQVGIAGQKKLKSSRVLVVGSGGLGSPVMQYLAAAGIGEIILVDGDTVDESNLHRQIIFDYDSLGAPKAKIAAEKVRKLNPDTKVTAHEVRLDHENALDLIGQSDLVIDCCDNFDTRYLINDACVILGKPYIYASIFQFEGLLTLFGAPDGPCYRCAFPAPPPKGLVPSCADGGVLGILPGVFGTLQAAEAVKYLLGYGKTLAGRMIKLNLLDTQFSEFQLPKNPNCKACSAPEKLKLQAPSQPQSCDTTPLSRIVSASKLKSMIKEIPQLPIIDVRSEEERKLTRIQDDIHIPLGALKSAQLSIDTDSLVVVYCTSGMRSKQAVDILESRGYGNAKSLTGGVLAWNSLEN